MGKKSVAQSEGQKVVTRFRKWLSDKEIRKRKRRRQVGFTFVSF
jgi:hypothetical protein